MANRDYGERGRGWERDWDVEDRYGRGGPYNRGYYGGGTTGEENWGRWGTSRGYGGYGEPSAGRGWEREGWGRESGYGSYRDYGGRYAGERGGYTERYGREPYYGSYGWEAGAYGGRYGGEGRRGTFVGRGPKGWRRSDDRIREEVNEALARHPDVDASDVEVRVENGVVTLSGVVEDRRQKRLAEDVVEDVFGVDDVDNGLKVRHGFLAGLTGERVDDREVARGTERETTGAGTTPGARTATGTRAGRTTGTTAR
ncbi:MAG TPA: BON domain-containing protein [Gemmatimonadaceae bacterium]|nr:BON domain-containing protein [Gemmatimonadaceae bacterium]